MSKQGSKGEVFWKLLFSGCFFLKKSKCHIKKVKSLLSIHLGNTKYQIIPNNSNTTSRSQFINDQPTHIITDSNGEAFTMPGASLIRLGGDLHTISIPGKGGSESIIKTQGVGVLKIIMMKSFFWAR